jgi:integrase
MKSLSPDSLLPHFNSSLFIRADAQGRGQLGVHIVFLTLRKSFAKTMRSVMVQSGRKLGLGHKSQMHLMIYQELIRHWVVFNANDQVTVTDTLQN